jgi:Asp-tRNA(Asn)/Glu-tRNA(Gln) amidotransferase A subunit family amidase
LTQTDDPTALGLVALVDAMAEGRLRPSKAIEAFIARIEALEPTIQAFAHFDAGQLREAARMRDGQPPEGCLYGAPVGIKDVFDTADMPTAYGSDFYADFRPMADAAAVCRLKEAGALIAGKTVTTEFASVAPPKTRNPHHPDFTPGGSSSGSAAAVAARMVPAALGTQTAGSVVRPAAYCGVVGYKPSFALLDRTGMKTLAQSFDTVGIFTRSVADAALVLGALGPRPSLAVPDEARDVRIGLYLPPWCALGEACASDVVRHAGTLLREAGFDIADIPALEGFDRLLEDQQAIMDWDMVQALSFELDHGGERLHPVTREALTVRRQRMSAEKYDAAWAHLDEVGAVLARCFETVDVLLVPSAPGEAPRGHANTGSSEFNRGWTSLRVPCINLPAGFGPNGMPLGVQLVGPRWRDDVLLAAAAQVERALAGHPYRA